MTTSKDRFGWRAVAGICLALTIIATGCSSGNNGNEAADPVPIESLPSPSPSAIATITPADTATPSPSATPSPEIDEVSSIVAKMTLEEKVGQMIMIGVDGTTLDQTAVQLIKGRHVGGVIVYKNNLGTTAGSVKLINAMKVANAGNAMPLLFGVDQEGGKVSRMPADFDTTPDNATVGKSNNADVAKSYGGVLADEISVLGLNLNFAPVLDVNSNPNNPVIGNRSYGATADLVTKMGVAEMKGIQEKGVIPTVKHFPGHGDTSVDSHLALPVVRKTTAQLEKMEWLPFRAAIENGADVVMVAHILFPLIDAKAPASFSKVIIGDQLRGTLGFKGVVITDDLTMGAIAKNYGIGNASIQSVLAGSDILLIAHDYDKMKAVYDQLLKSVKEGKISESRIDESVRRILALKLKYALSDEPTPIPTAADIPNAEIRDWKTQLMQATAAK
jgi:beta-N-acetylhexosaminidase